MSVSKNRSVVTVALIYNIGLYIIMFDFCHPPLSRRDFFRHCAGCACLFPLLARPGTAAAQKPRLGLINTIASPYYTAMEKQSVRCELCPKECLIAPGQRGACRVRENRRGRLYSLVYGNPCAIHLDPIEKNPLFHVLPASNALCLATAGCNFHCRFCQSWEMSQAAPEDVYAFDLPPEQAIAQTRNMGAQSVAFTYVEPVVFIEYAIAVGALARAEGLLSLVHTNGYVSADPLSDLCHAVDAANVDLKGFSDAYYGDMCEGALEPVLETLKFIRRRGVHLELTTLIVPGRNDDPGMIRRMALWIKENLGAGTPLHFFRFYPLYRLRRLPPTPVSVLERARRIALEAGLDFVYIGNVPGHEGENTFCPSCGSRIIHRTGYMVVNVHMADGACGHCDHPIDGIWDVARGHRQTRG